MGGLRRTCARALATHGRRRRLPRARWVPNPAITGLLDEPIEDYRYDGADHCTKRVPPGTKALAAGSTGTRAASLGNQALREALARQLQPPRREPGDRLAHGRPRRQDEAARRCS